MEALNFAAIKNSMRINILLLFLLAAGLLQGCTSNEKEADEASSPEIELRSQVLKYPDSLLLTENLIQYFRNSENYDQAIAEAETALNKDSLNDRLWNIKATLHFENSDTANAIHSFEKAIGINPRPEYILSLGSLYAQTKNPLALN